MPLFEASRLTQPGNTLTRASKSRVPRAKDVLVIINIALFFSHGTVAMFLQGASGPAGNTTALNPPAGIQSRSIWGSIKGAVNKAVAGQ